MDGLVLLFGVLALIFVGLVLAMNVVNTTAQAQSQSPSSDGFVDAPAAAAPTSALPSKIRAVLEPMTANGDDLCSLYTILRQTGMKNAKAGPGDPPSDAEAARQVEAEFALKIPGGALPCPLLTYPKDGATDLDWLAFLQTIPADFGARIVFMALYARDTLKEQLTTIKHSLGEGFQAICTPDVAASRRSAAQAKEAAGCTLPEDLSPAQINQAATDLLKSLVATKTSALTAKLISPTLDIAPIVKEAMSYAAQLKTYSDKAQSGTLDHSNIVGAS